MMRSVLSLALAYLLLGAGAPQATPSAPPVTYDADAVRFGILPAFSVAGLVAGAERRRTLDAASKRSRADQVILPPQGGSHARRVGV